MSGAVSFPYCWEQKCSSSEYGSDTEIVSQCTTIGICIQGIEVGGVITNRVVLSQNCTLNVSSITDPLHVHAGIPPPPVALPASVATSPFWVWGLVGLLFILVLIVAFLSYRSKPVDTYSVVEVQI